MPVQGRDGEFLRELCGRPAAIISFLDGLSPRRVQPYHCAELGKALAASTRAAGVEIRLGARSTNVPWSLRSLATP